MTTSGRTRRSLAVGAALLALALTSACSSGSDSMAEDEAGSGEAPAAAVQGSSLDSASAGAGKSGAGAVRAELPGVTSGRQVIYTGQVSVRAEDLDAVRRDVDDLLIRSEGMIADEETYRDAEGEVFSSRLSIRVPAENFTEVLTELAGLAPEVDVTSRSKDVTDTVIDVDARVRTQEVSLERLRGFLGGATDIKEVIALESEIATREADLASLRARQRNLSDQTAQSTITLSVERLSTLEDSTEAAGFLAGLRDGWAAFGGAVVAGLTVLGAVLPFLVTLTVVALAGWGLARLNGRRQPRMGTALAAATSPGQDASAVRSDDQPPSTQP